jgi:hypothetical protein
MVRIINEKFIPVAVDADMLNDVQDAEGKFARDTGIYLNGSSGGVSFATASGKLLGKKHLHGTSVKGIEEALQAWNGLPETERKPGAIKVGERGPLDAKHGTAAPPPGGLILKLYGRHLAREANGELRTTTLLKDFPGDAQDIVKAHPGYLDWICEAHPDFMWLTEAEWKSLVPASPKKGDTFSLPAFFTQRMCRIHMTPNNLYSRWGDTWPYKGGIRSAEATLTVEEVSANAIRLSLNGSIMLGKVYNAAEKDCLGYEARLRGFVEYDATKQAFTRFDIVALGEMYGVSRPGRYPVGFAFELASAAVPANRLPPRGNMTEAALKGYLAIGK